MDLSSDLKRGAVRIAKSLQRYAESKSWVPQDYRIFMIVNVEWSQFSAELVARAFDRGPTTDDYIEVMNFVRSDLRDAPELYQAFGLVLRAFDGYASFARRIWSANTVEVDDALLNPESQDIRLHNPFQPAAH